MESTPSGTPIGAIIGGVFAGVAVICAALAVYLLRRNRTAHITGGDDLPPQSVPPQTQEVRPQPSLMNRNNRVSSPTPLTKSPSSPKHSTSPPRIPFPRPISTISWLTDPHYNGAASPSPTPSSPLSTSQARNPILDRASVASSLVGSTTSTDSFGFTAADSDGGTGYRYRVRTPHDPQRSDEIRLSRSDVVSIWTVYEDAWCEGFNHTTRETGIFPLSCLRQSSKRKPNSSINGRPPSTSSKSVRSTASSGVGVATMLRSQRRTQSLAYVRGGGRGEGGGGGGGGGGIEVAGAFGEDEESEEESDGRSVGGRSWV
ncbi:hypothetical protein HDV00_000844 [Rhizophlyctis rosea]|nr:hypothetical protein HDV00_000844 [Rhizophlyctis rosea]